MHWCVLCVLPCGTLCMRALTMCVVKIHVSANMFLCVPVCACVCVWVSLYVYVSVYVCV